MAFFFLFALLPVQEKKLFFLEVSSSSCYTNYYLRWRYFHTRTTQHLIHAHIRTYIRITRTSIYSFVVFISIEASRALAQKQKLSKRTILIRITTTTRAIVQNPRLCCEYRGLNAIDSS